VTGTLWPMPKVKMDDLYDRRVAVYRNTTHRKNGHWQPDYIWTVEDYRTHKVLAIASEVPLVGGPLAWIEGANPAVVGRIPPGQLILSSAFTVGRVERATKRMGECICTSDGEVWATGNMPPVRYGC
jgi:hypothetical protein